MKSIARFLLLALCVVPAVAQSANVPSTRGNNLTAYNGASGVTNNNNWNALMNVRSGADAADMPAADFGNCNAIVLRCAQPKCANGGCVDMDVTSTIVAGCVRSNDACVQYGDELVQYISAQLVAQGTAKSNAAQAAAANAAAQQSAQQMAAMQQQMQQMQSQFAAQNAETVAQLQNALEEQKQLTAQAIADATAVRETAPVNNYVVADAADNNVSTQQSGVAGLSTAQQIAAQNGVSADILAREQITGQIMSSIENAETQLKALKATMTDTFDYAGCDTKGNNCTGPKRVKVFKQKAMDFFDPYENVLDEMYDALITAQAVGVDITDIYMMLNDSCNVWAQYLCSNTQTKEALYCDNMTASFAGGVATPTAGSNCRNVQINTWPKYVDGVNCIKGTSGGPGVRGGRPCMDGQVIPPEDDMSCTLQKTLTDKDEVQRNWLYAETSDMDANVRVGCASSALEQSKFFRNRKKGSDIDIAVLERIIEQDAPSVYGASFGGRGKTTAPKPDGVKFCAVNEESLADLEKIVSLKRLPDNVCVDDAFLLNEYTNNAPVVKGDDNKSSTISNVLKTQAQKNCESVGGFWLGLSCNCPSGFAWRNNNCVVNGTNMTAGDLLSGKSAEQKAAEQIDPFMGIGGTGLQKANNYKMQMCFEYGKEWDIKNNKCKCIGGKDLAKCMEYTK